MWRVELLNINWSESQGHVVKCLLMSKYLYHIGNQGCWIQRQCHNLVLKLRNSNVCVHVQYRFWPKTAQNDWRVNIVWPQSWIACNCHLFSERKLMFMFAICRRPSVCRLSVCNVRAPYSADWNFRQCFCAI